MLYEFIHKYESLYNMLSKMLHIFQSLPKGCKK